MTNMTLQALRSLVADDAYASSYQSMSHYRGALLRHFDNLTASAGSLPVPLTDTKAAKILVEMREHMLAWGEAQEESKPEGQTRLDIEDDAEEGFPEFAGECLRFLLPRLAEATRAAANGPDGQRGAA